MADSQQIIPSPPPSLPLQLSVPRMHHAIGNHCLSVPRRRLLELLAMPAAYYAVDLHDRWRLVRRGGRRGGVGEEGGEYGLGGGVRVKEEALCC